MPNPARQSLKTMWRHMGVVACLAGLTMWTASCDSKKPSENSNAPPPEEIIHDFRADLAGARVDLAKQALARTAPEEALPMLVSAVEANPSSWEAVTMATKILQTTQWFMPEVSIKHGPMSIDLIELDTDSSLWVAVTLNDHTDPNSGIQTAVKWNLETLQIESVLFPVRGNETSCMQFDPTHQYAVIKRSFAARDHTVLLCDALSLKPIRNLGPLPISLTPQSVIAFSADGLLLAHPTFVSADDHSIIWHLRDCKTGEIVRTSSPTPPDKPAPLTASLDRSRLRVMHADSTLLEMPVSPVEPEQRRTILSPIRLLQAQFLDGGASVDALSETTSNRKPVRITIPIDENPSFASTPASKLERFPWSKEPNIWNGLLREMTWNPLKVDQTRVTFPRLPFPSYDVNSSITAVALRGDRIAFGDINGTVNIDQTLPFPSVRKSPNPFPPRTLAAADIAAFAKLTETLTGNRYDSTTRSLIPIDPVQRLESFEQCDFEAISRMFPNLDFSTIRERIRATQARTAVPESIIPLWDRIARADTSRRSWPELLELTKNLSATPWHQKLAASTHRKKPGDLEKTFLEGDAASIMAAIQSAGNKGPEAAKALQLALASDHPEWIAACLEKAEDLPFFLRQLAFSRIAWLEGRRADALAVWPEIFPDLKEIRLDQDWDGWEQADFSAAYQDLRRGMGELLAELDLPEEATAEQRKKVAERFDNPETLKAIGRARFAKACLKAAFAFSAFKEEKETTFRLAARARELGEAPEPCLRAEAMALTSLGEYQNAHERWILLITEHPLATQKPGDYAEAAYTAFENSNPQQAMAILTTGLHRFPDDANFALRAGWVALLTGNADRAYRFLLSGRQIGFPEEKLENATALLAIAAAQSGAAEDAAAFYQDLIDLDPDWGDPATIDTLEWPEELKECLRDVSQGGGTL